MPFVLDKSDKDKIFAFLIASASIGAYLFLAYSKGPDEFLKNIALLFAGVLAGLLRGDNGSGITSNPVSGDTNIINKTVEEKKEGD